MKIGLIDVDGRNFPNLPLMKISQYHKSRGDNVSWWIGLEKYDIVYKSKVFDFTPDINYIPLADQIIEGGTAYGLDNKLPEEIENIMPDYSIYNSEKVAFGFLTRGCPRNCGFCIVTKKEWCISRQVADLENFWSGQKKIKLLDPNITACKDKEYLFQQLIDSKAKIDFTQGLDIRLLTDRDVEMLNQMKIEMLHFAWDSYEFKTYELLKEHRPKFKHRSRELKVYVLVNFNTTHEEDLERIYKLKELDYDPYVMIFDKKNAPRQTRLIQRWVNNKPIFRSTERFEEYDPKRG